MKSTVCQHYIIDRGYIFTQELEPKGTTKNSLVSTGTTSWELLAKMHLPIFTQELSDSYWVLVPLVIKYISKILRLSKIN